MIPATILVLGVGALVYAAALAVLFLTGFADGRSSDPDGSHTGPARLGYQLGRATVRRRAARIRTSLERTRA